MTSRNDITQEYLKECFDYNPETGSLAWKKRPGHHFKRESARLRNINLAGTVAGTMQVTLYGSKSTSISVKHSVYQAHRIIWRMVTGLWPKNEIDHIDGNGCNNAWDNLREASRQENAKNRRLSPRNLSGKTGVQWNKANKKWLVSIGVNGKRKYLGQYNSKEAAIIRRTAAELKYNYHQNHGAIRPQ